MLEFNQHPFLKDLGLSEDNNGCYHSGKWVGNGKVITSYNPATNQPIARIRLGSM
jgi:aldehyde dehydrogenase family 7 protein A1